MEKLCITPKDSPKDIDEILDELCVVYMKNGEEANKQAAKEEGQMLESEIQTAIEKAHEAVKSHAQISVATASHSEFVAHPSPPIILQGSLNPASPPPPPKVLTAVKKKQEFLKARQPVIRESSPEAIESTVIWRR